MLFYFGKNSERAPAPDVASFKKKGLFHYFQVSVGTSFRSFLGTSCKKNIKDLEAIEIQDGGIRCPWNGAGR